MSHTLVKTGTPNKPPVPPHVALVELVKDDLLRVNNVIDELGNSQVSLINDIASRLINSGGKRLRPLLTLVSAKLCNYKGDSHIQLAAAVEFMHTATLLHDDVVDESKMRRGIETANEKWDNKSSVLVGDFLLGHAFCLMVKSNSVEVLRILSNASAIIAEGEVKQLVATNNINISIDDYIDIISSKTATLFSAACEIIPVIAECSEKEITALRNFGLYLGIAFQIADDILDYSAKEEQLGKTIGDDFREGKVTLPVIFSYMQGNKEEREFWHRVIQNLDQRDGDLEHALTLIQQHNTINQSVTIAKEYIDKAKEALSVFEESPAQETLLDLLDFSINRLY